MTPDKFSRLALAIPGAIESPHTDCADFWLGGQIFASLRLPNTAQDMRLFTPEHPRDFIAEAPGVFKACAGYWDERGATKIRLPEDRAAWVQARSLLAQAVVPSSASGRKTKSGKP